MNEAYIRDAVVHRLIPLPVDMEDVHAEHMEKPLQVDHSNLSSLKKTLDAFALKHGFVVKQMYRTTSNAKWACRPKLKSAQQEDERADTTCIFSVNANVRKAGGVYITSMNLNHNHALQTDDELESVDISSIEAQAIVWAMPPIGPSHRVADLCAGSGACSEKVLAAYPDIEIVLFDGAKDRLDLAVQRLRATVSSSSSRAISFHVADLNKISILRKAPFDVIVASLAVHVLVERPAHDCHPSSSTPPRRNDKEAEHKRVFQLMFNSLSPNGHVLLGDHVGQASLFSHLKWMEDVGFVDVDCAWRQDDFFVIGGRRPPHLRGQLVL
ncbi:hypothetical protein DYB32_001471 [Aphanomyces invadans]|uniref:Methyltransferase domain-containing protein n=1 Tax=Aphanomyces invadans TaxID=157072 RepID=A0A3R6VG45_9STRA|nr:hypothetical protein DYB32_001471 [Aphanomyces invadans]